MSHSRLYQLLEPMPDAASALARGRDLLRTHGSREPDDPCADLKPVTTAEQLAHSLAYFTKARLLGYPAPEDAAALRAGLVRLDIPHQEEDGDEGLLIDVELRPQVLELWPLPSPLTLLLWPADPFWFEESTEAELDAKVAALGPLAMDISWDCPLRGLPDPKLCGVQVCLNSAWREQCSDSEPGSFGVYRSIGPALATVRSKTTGYGIPDFVWGNLTPVGSRWHLPGAGSRVRALPNGGPGSP